MPQHKITYRPNQGGWVVFDADRATLQERMNGGHLPVVFVGGPDEAPVSVEKCHAWIATRRAPAALPLRVERWKEGGGWWAKDANGAALASTKTKKDALAVCDFVRRGA